MPVTEHIFGNNVRWIDVNEPGDDELAKLGKDFNLKPSMLHDCFDAEQLPKSETSGELRFQVMRYYSQNSDTQVSSIREISNRISVFSTSAFVITVHLRDIQFVKDMKRKFLDNNLITTAPAFAAQLFWEVLQTYHLPAQRLDEQVDFFENNIYKKRLSSSQLQSLYFVKRKSGLINKILLLSNEVLNSFRNDLIDSTIYEDLKDQHLKFLTIYGQLLEDVNNLLNLYMSLSAQKTNDVMKVLTIISVFFMPLTFIVGVYGMNFTNMPELQSKWGYPVVLVIMALLVGATYYYFKKQKWL